MKKTFFSENHLGIGFQNFFQLLVDFRGVTSVFPISSAAFASSWSSFSHVLPTIKNVWKLCINLDFIILLNTYYCNFVPYPQYIRKYTGWVSFVGLSLTPTSPNRAKPLPSKNPTNTHTPTPSLLHTPPPPPHTLTPSNSGNTHLRPPPPSKEYLPPTTHAYVVNPSRSEEFLLTHTPTPPPL